MGDPRIVFVSREVYPFDSAGGHNRMILKADRLAACPERVTELGAKLATGLATMVLNVPPRAFTRVLLRIGVRLRQQQPA